MNRNLFSLSIDAHQTAVEKGFWRPGVSGNPTATKVALIHTEIAELDAALRTGIARVNFAWSRSKQEQGIKDLVAEEAADVVIRCADLAHAIGCNLTSYALTQDIPEAVLDEYRFDLTALLLKMHSSATAITQNDRKEQISETHAALGDVVHLCFVLAEILRLSLWDAIESKMEINRARPKMHGRRY